MHTTILVCFVWYRLERYCQKTTSIKGVIIPEGAVVVFPVHWLHHSPLYWSDPEMFSPDRYTHESLLLYNVMQLIITNFNTVGYSTDLLMRKEPSDLNFVTCPLGLVLATALG